MRERGVQDGVLVHGRLVELGDDPAAAHDEHAMGEPEHLLVLGRDQQDGDPLGGERLDQRVDRGLRARRRRPASARRR